MLFVLLLCTNSVFLLSSGTLDTLVMLVCMGMCFFFWIWPDVYSKDYRDGRVKQLHFGNIQLVLFLEALIISIVYTFLELFKFHMVNDKDIPLSELMSNGNGFIISASWKRILAHIVVASVFLSITFWIGIIRLYLTSVQLGIKHRVIGILCGWIFPVNIIALIFILNITHKEVVFENEKAILNEKRIKEQICATKYPVLLLHGVFFRDFKYLDYWGRIPGELTKNGCRIFYGEQQSAAPVSESGKEVARKILEIMKVTGAQKVNIIAHSKGGLDARSAMSDPEVARHVASLTTINTPHRGCDFADYLLNKIPESIQKKVAGAYNGALKKVGDYNPDFIGACKDLTASACLDFNNRIKDPPGVYITSYGSVLKKARGGRFPLNMTYRYVGIFDGKNDGLVATDSFSWGAEFHMLEASGMRGISHGDMIDLNRENIPGFDVREFYVQLVADLKKKGF